LYFVGMAVDKGAVERKETHANRLFLRVVAKDKVEQGSRKET
jgi:hypothetical protein